MRRDSVMSRFHQSLLRERCCILIARPIHLADAGLKRVKETAWDHIARRAILGYDLRV